MFVLLVLAALAGDVDAGTAPTVDTQLVWMLGAMVVAFGLGSGSAWLHATANRTRATNPAAADAFDALGTQLLDFKKAIASGVPLANLGDFAESALEAYFHAHAVTLGKPHDADPRAP